MFLPNTKIHIPRCMTPTESFVEHYPQAKDFANNQLKCLWFPDEVKLEKDIQSIKVEMTEAEAHGVITVLRLFTLYELKAGNYWTGKTLNAFPRPEIMRMASIFGAFELGIHQPFYARLNELLNLNTDEFFLSYVTDPLLKDRMDFVSDVVKSTNYLESIGAFSMIEGAVLYSSFAYLKHFQVNGKNKLLNVVRGINFSAVDENQHTIAGGWLYNLLKNELLNDNRNSKTEVEDYIGKSERMLTESAHKIYEHESYIVDMIFEKGQVEGITSTQLKHFVESRINMCLDALGIAKPFKVNYNPIADWFYDGLNNYQSVDFFSGIGREYSREWTANEFAW